MHPLQLAPWLLLAPLCAPASEPALRVLRSSASTVERLHNGTFEQLAAGQPQGWRPWRAGFQFAPGEGFHDSGGVRCLSTGDTQQFGASQTVTLDQTEPLPLVVSGFSRAENVTGTPDSGYSIYVDLIYSDGTPLWGQTGNFRCGTHDWEERRLVIVPEKPVQSLTVHCLFRGHAGSVWFDDVSVQSLQAGGDTTLFQNVPVQVVATDTPPPADTIRTLLTQDGLAVLTSRRRPLQAIRLGSQPTNTTHPIGLLGRDVAADSDFFSLPYGECPELRVNTRFEWSAHEDHLALSGSISDVSQQDRAITLVFAVPLDAAGLRWGDDFRRSRLISGRTEYLHSVPVRCGSTGTMSLYPLGAVWNDADGLALALDMRQPAVYRVGYHAGLHCLFLAYDFGLVPDTEASPSSADFRLVLYRFDPRWGFRAAWDKFMRIFPDAFKVRTARQGLWMPFTDVASVRGWEDFGFRFHEGNNNVPWDDDHGVLSFRYTEPMTWWMPMPDDAPRTLASALRIRAALAETGNPTQRRMARVSQIAAMHDEQGQPTLQFRDEPWCRGAVWSLNPNPYLGQTDPAQDTEPPNAATVHWNQPIQASLYGPSAQGELDGEYLDSLEGYVTAELNFRREHFRASSVPLTFTTESARPALFKGLAVFEFTRWIAEDLHRRGKLTFANSVPYRFTFLGPWLDVMGTETDWMPNGRYRPSSDEQMLLWRGLAGRKPYLLLMNTDYDRFSPPFVERYFQRALFYGMWPGFFSHNAADHPYWKNPDWYERDRPLFKRYIPLIGQVAEAGWQPITHATSQNQAIPIERFGPDATGRVFLTLHNEQEQTVSDRIQIDHAALGIPIDKPVSELVQGDIFLWPKGGWVTSLEPQTTQVLCLRRD